MELKEKLVRRRLDYATETYHHKNTSEKEKHELAFEIIFLERLLRYCGKDL